MILSQFRILLYAYIPTLKQKVADNSLADLILNNAVIDIAAYTCCLKTSKKFSVTAEQQEYNLSTVIGNYLVVDKPGLWWNDGTSSSPDWKQLNPKTLKAIDNDRPNWRSNDSDSPQDYSIDGDVVTIVPKPNTTLNNGFWLYYGAKPVLMTDENHYPFSGSAIEYTHLSVFDGAILSYAQWKFAPVLSKDGLVDITEAQYKRIREEAFNSFKKRRDIVASGEARFHG